MTEQSNIADSGSDHCLLEGFNILWAKFSLLQDRQEEFRQYLLRCQEQNVPPYDETSWQAEFEAFKPLNFTVREEQAIADALRIRGNLDEQLIGHKPKISRPDDLPKGHPPLRNDDKTAKCPFAQTDSIGRAVQSGSESDLPSHGSPFSPQKTSGHTAQPAFTQDLTSQSSLPPPSVTGSYAKCPIRLLDERPPEEIAEYFETHKHEIPRSHEICVKRHQSNAQSIRQLDAKYGNLVNMIQGLGVKHQPLLPVKEGEEEAVKEGEEKDEDEAKTRAVTKDKSSSSVEQWAQSVSRDTFEAVEPDVGERAGHFDRPLHEIRVGESPSRPWGIRVPDSELAASANDHIDSDVHCEFAAKSTTDHTHPRSGARSSVDPLKDKAPSQPSQMIFTGPVFIGYPPEGLAELLRHFKPSEQEKCKE